MFAQKITGFLGITPRTAERLLPDMGAQIAENVILTSGEIRPMRPAYPVFYPGSEKQTAYRAFDGTTEKWMTWDVDVDITKAPLSPDVEARYYWTGDGCPRYAKFSEINVVSYAVGIPNPTQKPAASATGGTGSTVNRSYCYTFFQPDTGEETGPSPVAAITTGKVDGTWTISGFSNTPANDRAAPYRTAGLKQRLYRTTGTTGSWQLVAERAVATTNWTDTLTDAQILGDELVSSGWEPPPVGMKGLITIPNGCTVGFVGNQLCYSEPYQPHTYPKSYRYQTESPIVGIAAYGTTVVVCTQTRPYLADGVTPDVVTMQAVSNIWPCKSKRSVASAGDGVIFATETGLAYVGQAGEQIMTKAFFTAEEWRPLVPSSMHVRVIDNRIYLLFLEEGAATKRLLRMDMGEAAALTSFSSKCQSLYADPLNGYLYLVGSEVQLFDGTYGQRETYVWQSKEIELAESTNPAACIIEWQATMNTTEIQAAYSIYNAARAANQLIINAKRQVGAFAQVGFNTDPINGSSSLVDPPDPTERLTYTLLDHGVARFSKDVLPGVPFRLPSGYKTDVLAHQLVGNVRVKYIKVAESMIGLKAV